MKYKISFEDINKIKEVYKNGNDTRYVPSNSDDINSPYFIKSERFFCDLKNDELLDIIKNNIPIDDVNECITSIHYINYKKGEGAKEHSDIGASNKTFIFILNDEFEGGEFHLDKNYVPLVKGDIIAFNGSQLHLVKPIKKGNREVLVVFLKNK